MAQLNIEDLTQKATEKAIAKIANEMAIQVAHEELEADIGRIVGATVSAWVKTNKARIKELITAELERTVLERVKKDVARVQVDLYL